MAKKKLKTQEELEQEGFASGGNGEFMKKLTEDRGFWIWRLANPGNETRLYENAGKHRTAQDLEQEGFYDVRDGEYMVRGSFFQDILRIWEIDDNDFETGQECYGECYEGSAHTRDRLFPRPSYRKFFELDKARAPWHNDIFSGIDIKRNVLIQAGFDRLQIGEDKFIATEDASDQRVGNAYKNIRRHLYE